MANNYLMYHPRRKKRIIDVVTIYHDQLTGNQDPYIWNRQFLHTFCHITQIQPGPGTINFWVSGDTFPNFNYLYCDLVFVVAEKCIWPKAQNINPDNPIVDSPEAYNDHYQWAFHHPFKRRSRYTLKANPALSFQPQNQDGSLLDVVPFFLAMDIPIADLRQGMQAAVASKPLGLSEDLSSALYSWIAETASVKLTGEQLQTIRQSHKELASPPPH
ncbi:MAG: hypothetical protein PHQ40_21090 [Anaerolineaceae bacterium]|nr:hypothetical protein [Anaerolineaceae bacterium]